MGDRRDGWNASGEAKPPRIHRRERDGPGHHAVAASGRREPPHREDGGLGV